MIVYATRNGISETELHDLIPELNETFWSLLCYILHEYLILTSVAGLLVFDNDQVDESSLMYMLINMFHHSRLCLVSGFDAK